MKMSRTSILLVILQFIFLLGLLYKGPLIYLDWWGLFQITGFVIAVSGVIHIGITNFNIQPEVKSENLIRSGIYGKIRNPMYLGILLFFIPFLFNDPHLSKYLFYFSLFVVFLLKIKSEEQFLEEKFGKQYLDYKRKTYRLLPFIF